jgi:hypothetical protein
MTAAQQALRHAGAHPTKTDHRKFHSVCLELRERAEDQYSPAR